MGIKITVSFTTTNHGDGEEIHFTKTHESGLGNPRYDGSNLRKSAAELTAHIVRQVNRLVDEPLED